MLEHIAGKKNDDRKPKIRLFGFIFTILFIIIALSPIRSNQSMRVWALFPAAFFLASTLIAPKLLKPIEQLWFYFGEVLHRITSPLILFILFYFIILPTGLFIRFLNKDPLNLRIDKTQKSYWIERKPEGPLPESLDNQF